MQIDLLATNTGELGLLGDSEFETPVSGVIFDVAERSLTLEFGEAMDSMRLNVPVAEDFVGRLKTAPFVHICVVAKGRMVQATQAPLVKVSIDEDDDFYYGEIKRGVSFVQQWIGSVRSGQPIHRDQLGNESTARGIIPDLSAASLRIAPQLAQVLAQEQALARQHAPQMAPQMAPPSLGPGSSMNLGMSQRAPRPPTSTSDEG